MADYVAPDARRAVCTEHYLYRVGLKQKPLDDPRNLDEFLVDLTIEKYLSAQSNNA